MAERTEAEDVAKSDGSNERITPNAEKSRTEDESGESREDELTGFVEEVAEASTDETRYE